MLLNSKTSFPITLKIFGMDCAEEIAILKREVLPLVGREEDLSFDLLNGKMTIRTGKEGVSVNAVLAAIQKTGMRAEVWKESQDKSTEISWWERQGRTVLTVSSGFGISIGLGLHAGSVGSLWAALGAEEIGKGHEVPLAARFFYLFGAILGSWFVAPKAVFSLKKLRPDMNLLMMIAVMGAISIGEWFEAATVAFLFSLSLLLESWSVQRARRAVQSLMDLAPTLARIQTPDGVREVSPSDVKVGATLLIRPGEKVPLDGRVVSGSSYLNQASITGESVPVLKEPGAEVFAGTVNGDGSLVVKVTKAASDTTLSHIVRMVAEAQSRKGPSEQWVEKFAKIYTPSVLALACLILLIPPLFFHASWAEWLYRALVLLVIACPCALVISTPVSIVSSLAAAASKGVLIKGGVFIEIPARIKAIAMDKTGTLTEGKPRVIAVVPLEGHSESELLELAGGMESHSDHPLARAILEYAEQKNIKPVETKDFQILQGKGATATIHGETYWLGSHRFLEEKGQETPEIHEKLERLTASGSSVVIVGNHRHVCGFITLADAVRSGIKETLQALRREGVDHIVMLTGDNRKTAENVAKEAGIDEALSELLPADKVRSIEILQKKYGNVAMIGDGINDAPALARATLGIAMGVAGSDAALETADVALMSDDLTKLPWLIQHSRRTLRIIRQNITASLLVKAVFVLLTFLGHSSLWSAIAADMGASLAVVFNGLRLLRTERKV